MDEALTVFKLALLPAIGNFSGGLLSEWFKNSGKRLNWILHIATGIMLAIIAVEIMPEALGRAPGWVLALSFFIGGLAYLLIKRRINRWQETKATGMGTGAWMIYVAVATDLIGDGLLIGIGATVSTRLALLVAIGQIVADIPEGFALLANFRDKGMTRGKRILTSASLAIPVVASALLSYAILRDFSELIKMIALVFVAGTFMLAAVEDVLFEAHESAEDTHWSGISFLAGFSFFLILSGWV